MFKTPHDGYLCRSLVSSPNRLQALWLTTRRFENKAYRPLLVFDRKAEYATEDKNIHTLFRKNFRTDAGREIARAVIYITGDDFYKLYINSAFVGEGPAQSYPFAYNYNCFDITDLIDTQGENAIGVHVYYQGLFNIYLMSADNAHGMLAQLEITYTDGTRRIIASDRTWRCRESFARTPRHIFGYETQFSEDIDLTAWDAGWCDANADLTDWDIPCTPSVPYPMHYSMVPQITPAVAHEKIHPVQIRRTDNGYFMDFGKEYVGTLALRVRGERGDVLTIRCGEETEADGSVRFKLRAGCVYEEFVTLSGGDDFVDFFDFKGFRYAEVSGISELDADDVWIMSRSYPFPEAPAKFSSSDADMNRIWEICAHGVKIGTQDTYLDCPTREKGGFIGDALITALSHYTLTGDARVFKKFLTDCIHSARIFPGIVCHVPTYNISPAADYSLLLPLLAHEYFLRTGDTELIEMLLQVTDQMLLYHRRWENSDGLLEGIEHPYGDYDAFVLDWPENMRDGCDFDALKRGVCTTINMHYYGALKYSAKLYRALGNHEKAQEYSTLCDNVGAALIRTCLDADRGVFTDSPGSSHTALHQNALALFYLLEPPAGYGPIARLIGKKRLYCGVYFAYFVIKGLYNSGFADIAWGLLSSKETRSWHSMLQCGATACTEVWSPEMKSNTSLCHPWSSSPIIFYTQDILGVQYTQNTDVLRISPNIPPELSNISAELPTPCGRISISFTRSCGEAQYKISAPSDVHLELCEKENMRYIVQQL